VIVCVVGCGAVGSLFAANLATLVDVEVWAYDLDKAHVAAIDEQGLRLTGAGEVHATWRSVLTEAFTAAAHEYGVSDAGVPALVTLVMTFTMGMFNERLVGVDTGHAELLAWFEGAIRGMETAA